MLHDVPVYKTYNRDGEPRFVIVLTAADDTHVVQVYIRPRFLRAAARNAFAGWHLVAASIRRAGEMNGLHPGWSSHCTGRLDQRDGLPLHENQASGNELLGIFKESVSVGQSR